MRCSENVSTIWGVAWAKYTRTNENEQKGKFSVKIEQSSKLENQIKEIRQNKCVSSKRFSISNFTLSHYFHFVDAFPLSLFNGIN